jgi:hypothetical protein
MAAVQHVCVVGTEQTGLQPRHAWPVSGDGESHRAAVNVVGGALHAECSWAGIPPPTLAVRHLLHGHGRRARGAIAAAAVRLAGDRGGP